MNVRAFMLAVAALSIGACAPPGSHYGMWNQTEPLDAFIIHPDDACLESALRSPGAVSLLNAKIGQPDGPSRRVAEIESLDGYNTRVNGYSALFGCRGTLLLEGGARERGTLTVDVSAKSLSWESDTAKKRRTETPESAAMRAAVGNYCATASPAACSYFTSQAVEKENRCVRLSSTGYSLLTFQVRMIEAGMTPQQATDLSARTATENSSPSWRLSSGEVFDLAAKAAKVIRDSGFIDAASFGNKLGIECRKAAFGQ
jgi:hypothetical protein